MRLNVPWHMDWLTVAVIEVDSRKIDHHPRHDTSNNAG